MPGAAKEFRSPAEFARADAHLERILEHPFRATQPVGGWEGVRKLRIGQCRLFLWIDEKEKIVYGLAYLPRKTCYQEKERVIRIVKRAIARE